MVVAGGDMALGDPPPGEMGWRIEVPALDHPGSPGPRRLVVAGVCVSTSGDRFQRLELEGKRFSHVLDPRTGWALTDHSQVTVVAPRGMDTEGLSKVLSVLGMEEGFGMVEEIEGAAALVVRAPEGEAQWRASQRWERYEKPAPPVGGRQP
jgi:thiamine biosynthesis lipoprotein